MQPFDMQAVAADFNRATQAHGAGRIADAQAIYLDILGRAPNHVGALHLLGVCHFQQGRFAEGLPWVEKALAFKPDYVEAHNNLGNGLKALRRFDEAIVHYRRAIELQPGFGDGFNNLGVALMENGKPQEAWPQFEKALSLLPARPDVLNNAGAALSRLGRHAEALDLLRAAVASQPRYADAHNNLGGVLREMGRHDEALASFAHAIEIRPDYVAALYNHGNALASLQRPLEALASYDRALAREPDNLEVLNNRGIVLQTLGRPEEAIASLDRAVALDPTRAEPLCNRANSYRDLHQFDAALADYGQAIAARGDYPEAAFNRSVLHLLRGDYAAGWPDYEERWRFPKFIANSAGHLTAEVIARLTLRPERAALAGKRCLVVGEQGLGDQIMFASMLGELMRDAAEVTCLVDRKLAGLLQRSLPGARIGDIVQIGSEPLGGIDHLLAIGSLAYAYRRTAADFSGAPYLTPDPKKTEAWRARLGIEAGRRVVGLSWRGGTALSNGASRSLTLEALLPALDAVPARFVGLQYGDVAEEVAAFNARHGRDIICLPREEIESFDDLAALVSALDGVLSVQTALIHLCGALGRDCVTLVPRQPEWRYGLTAETAPWYRSVRLVRQGSDGDWAPVVARAAALLRDRMAGS